MIYTDQLNRKINLPFPPKRIISLVPSQTELLWHYELREELVGITKFCIHPENMFRTVQKVGGTKKLHLEEIRKLNPDLIVANKEENQQEEIEILCKEFPVYISDIITFEDALEMMRQLGEITQRSMQAKTIIHSLVQKKNNIQTDVTKSKRKYRVAYLIWKNPFMAAGSNTFISEMIQTMGLSNVFAQNNERYPVITTDDLKRTKPDFIFLSSEPYPFKEKHVKELEQITAIKTILVDGELFSWYGSRLLHSFNYFKKISEHLDSFFE